MHRRLWGSALAEQKVWNKGTTTYVIFKAREGEAYFISWAIGSWLISMLGHIQYFSRHQKTCWDESSVPTSGRHVPSVLYKIGTYFSCSAYCKLQSMAAPNQILNHRSGRAAVFSMARRMWEKYWMGISVQGTFEKFSPRPVFISRAKITHRWVSVNLKRHLQKAGGRNICSLQECHWNWNH